ncbi:MAG TPA: ABC transporter permease [Gemmatimonadales bacterium]|jgi:predicted permease
MPKIRTWLRRRLRALLHSGAIDRELDDEIRLHVDLEAAELMEREGLSAAEARRRAMIALGGAARMREEHRDVRGVRWLEHRGQDIRYAVRGLRNRPGFTLAVVLTLALGIGANAAMFSIVDRLLFRAPPLMRDPAMVHRVVLSTSYRGVEGHNTYIPYARFVDVTRNTHSFSRTALFTENELAVGVGTDAREMQVGAVTSGFFGFFNARPILGRYFTAAEDSPPIGAAVVVLSYGFWESQYGARPDVIGRHIQVGATLYTVIGVAPRGFAGVWPETPPVAYIPASARAGEQRYGGKGDPWWTTYHWTWAQSMVERKPGVTIAQANADLSQAYLHSYQAEVAASPGEQPVAIARPHASVASILSDRGPNESSLAKVATWIGGVALIVWLIACANVANLLLARALQRRREIAVRLALGVTRSRLAAQLLTESTILALLGGLSGVLIAQWGGAVLRAEFLSKTSTASVMTDPRTLIYAGAAALVAGLLTGLAPLLQTRRMNLNSDLKAGAREGGYQRSGLRAGLLILQGTLSVVLLVGAGLFVRSLRHVKAVPLGFEPEHVVMVETNMRGVPLDSARSQALVEQLQAAVAAVPGVTNATRQLTMPFWSTWSLGLTVAGIDSVDKLGQFNLDAVSPTYFATMGTRIMQGRGIEARDAAGAPGAMVVSQAMAKKLWPGASPIGQCVRIDSDTLPCTYVVGVAENIKADHLGDDPGLFYYLSAAQFHPNQGGLFVRVQGDPDRMKEPVRKALQRLMPGASYITVTPIGDIIGEQTQPWQLGASMFVIFGALALILAAIGLYGVIAFTVSQRLHELGVRVALGASGRDIVRHVVTGGLRLAVVGVGCGVVLALVLGHWVAPLLFEESARDPAVFGVVAAVLLAVAALASYIPARRAAQVNPIRALRAE